MLLRIDYIRRYGVYAALCAFADLSVRIITNIAWRIRDSVRCSYSSRIPSGDLRKYFTRIPAQCLTSRELLSVSVARYLAHYFNLLGSGWVRVKRGMVCRGLEGYRYPPSAPGVENGAINRLNRKESRRIRDLIDPDYTPIDWQIDFKSGYRWSENTWYTSVSIGGLPGVDIKVPWELARMQHLSQLACAYALAKERESSFETPDTYAREFRNQVLDFIAANPPRFGVNWRCTMDVAIRAANWLVSYDLLRAQGADFDEDFVSIFVRSVYEHGRHIARNMEWNRNWRGNHYFANIVGLLYVAAYLPESKETAEWLRFGIEELVAETTDQFHPDGTNFESSTGYHRLTAEMAVYGTAIALAALKGKRSNTFSEAGDSSVFARLEKMAQFVVRITKPNGRVPQIGDNDSGRFFKFCPAWHRMTVAEAKVKFMNLAGYNDLPDDALYLDEDDLDHRHLVAAINGFFERKDFAEFSGPRASLETHLVRQLLDRAELASIHLPSQTHTMSAAVPGKESLNVSFEDRPCLKTTIPVIGGGLRKGLRLYAFPDFGLYLYRSERLYLAIRCDAMDRRGNRGHAHNDQLSIEMNVDGEDWILDPGTYLYTPLPERRNDFRSVKSHFCPSLGREPRRLDQGLFVLRGSDKAECLHFLGAGFLGVYHVYNEPVYRRVVIKDGVVEIEDFVQAGTLAGYRVTSEKSDLLLIGDGKYEINTSWSPKYGVIYGRP